MYQFPIGVVVESFRKEIHEAIKEASKLGLDGIQMYGTRGDFTPENFTAEYLKSTWINDYLFSRAIPENLICKVRSVKKEFCFDASIGTDGSVTVYDKSGENT